jgi:hypothetical protein
MEEHLEQHVSEFLAHVGSVTLLDCLREFVAFLKQVLHEALVRLFRVPRTTAL